MTIAPDRPERGRLSLPAPPMRAPTPPGKSGPPGPRGRRYPAARSGRPQGPLSLAEHRRPRGRNLGPVGRGLVRRLGAFAGVPQEGPLARRPICHRRGRRGRARWRQGHGGSPQGRHPDRLRRPRQLRRFGRTRACRHGGGRHSGAGQAPLRLHLHVQRPDREVPLLIDTSGAYVRPEGEGFICGASPEAELDPDWHDADPAARRSTSRSSRSSSGRRWPTASPPSRRSGRAAPGRGLTTCPCSTTTPSWPGPARHQFLSLQWLFRPWAAAIPGHGARISELIVDGRYRTLDLSDLGYERVLANRPLLEPKSSRAFVDAAIGPDATAAIEPALERPLSSVRCRRGAGELRFDAGALGAVAVPLNARRHRTG